MDWRRSAVIAVPKPHLGQDVGVGVGYAAESVACFHLVWFVVVKGGKGKVDVDFQACDAGYMIAPSPRCCLRWYLLMTYAGLLDDFGLFLVFKARLTEHFVSFVAGVDKRPVKILQATGAADVFL